MNINVRYGGTLLGPARFTHIETCATEVCREYERNEELQDCKSSLAEMDSLLLDMRTELAQATTAFPAAQDGDFPSLDQSPAAPATAKKPDYTNLDLDRAKRLVRARESAIKSVRASLVKHRKGQP